MALDFMPPVVVRLVADIKDFQAKVAAAEAQMGAASTRMGKSFNMVGAAAGVAGLAVAGFATKLAIDGVQAAIEDEKAASKLAQTMTNLGLAHDTGPVEAMIDAMQRQYGVADDKLRPAMEVLLRSTKDTAQAQGLLKVAMDVSAGTGKDLESVTTALAKAANGQTTALRRLVPELDANVLKSGNLRAVTDELSATFGGQAQKAANTYEGQIKRLGIAFDELKESFGYGFLDALGSTQDGTDGLMTSIKNLEPAMRGFGAALGDGVRGLGYLVQGLTLATGALDKFGRQMGLNTDIASGFFGLITRSPLAILGDQLTALNVLLNEGEQDWRDYWGAASGYSEPSGGGNFDTGDGIGGKNGFDLEKWRAEQFQKRNTYVSGFGYVTKFDTKGTRGSLLDDAVDQFTGGGGGAAKAKEKLVPVGMTIVDGLIQGITLGKVKLDEAAQGTLDNYIRGVNDAITAKREYAAQIGKSMVDMLSLDDAVQAAEKTGASIVDAFVEQSKKVAAFGVNMVKLAEAGLNQTSWEQIYAMGAQNGAKVADALLNGNIAENIARTNEAVKAVQDQGAIVAQVAAQQYKQTGIDTAFSYLDGFINQVSPKGKKYKDLMAALDALAEASKRTTTLTMIPQVAGGSVSVSDLGSAMESYTGPVFAPGESIDLSNIGVGVGAFADGGWVPRTGMAKVHAREFVLSRDMISGRKPIPMEVKQAVASSGGTSITVNASTNADPFAISREIAWRMKVGVM